MNSESLKTEIISNVLIDMNGHIGKEAMEILRYTLEKRMESINVERIATLPAECRSTVEEQNRYYVELMMVKKKNLGERTKQAYKSSVVRLMDYVGKPLDQMGQNDIDLYLHWYEHKNECSGGRRNQSTTCNNERRYLSAFFGWMKKEQFMSYNPVDGTEALKETQKPIDYFRPIEIEELRENCGDGRERALIEVLRSTGARVGEIVPLNITDIDWKTGNVLILSEKSGRYRTIYFDEPSRYYLREYLDSRTDANEALFVEKIKPYRRLSISGIEAALRKVGKRAGITGRTYPHKMRKTLGMTLRNAGVDIGSIQEILGHSDPGTTARYYAQTTPENLCNIRSRIA